MDIVFSVILGISLWPITLLFSWVIVHPQEEVVLLWWGKYWKTLKQPGLYFAWLIGRRVMRISTKRLTLELPKNTVADGNGNPIQVAGVVTHFFEDTRRAALDVEHAEEFVRSQALAVLKQIASRHPYESRDGVSLKNEAKAISAELVGALQQRVAVAGARIETFELSDLAYAPEIAQAMLIRQQAAALVDARKVIVEGAVEIVSEAVDLLEKRQLGVEPGDRSRLVSNLLTVICGDAKVQPTFPIASGEDKQEERDLLRKMLGQLEKMPKAGSVSAN